MKKIHWKYFLLLFLIIPVFFFFSKQESSEVVLEEPEEAIKEEKKSVIKVDVKGAVLNPGLYEFEEGSRVSDAIHASGGLLETADTSFINLSKLLKDEMVIIIYTKEEIHSLEEGKTAIKYIEKQCVCPSIKNDGCVEESKKETNQEKKETYNGMVSLNTGTLQELMSLTGIGESKAQAIISYREQNGPFTDIHDITKVSGIGEATFEKIKDRLTV